MNGSALKEAMLAQATACQELGSPFTARLLRVTAKNYPRDGRVWDMMANFEGDLGPSGASVPLRYAGALHAICLNNLSDDLSGVYQAAGDEHDDKALMKIISNAVDLNDAFCVEFLKTAPQTNEIRRAAILLPAFMKAIHKSGVHNLVMSELGASAGLNMLWDQFRFDYGKQSFGPPTASVFLNPDLSGTLPEFQDLTVVEHAGCDLFPIDVTSDQAVKKLLAYIWADQSDRMIRTREALQLRQKSAVTIDKSDAIDWLEQRLSKSYENALHIVYHTIAWQYFPKEKQEQGRLLLERAGKRATTKAPLAWVSFEADGQTPGAALHLQIWPSGEKIYLARGDFHGRWINWLN